MRCNTLNLDLVNISQLRQHGSKYFTPRPAPTLGCGQRSNSTISELGHVSYQVKWNQKCSNMVAIILPADPHPALSDDMGDGIKGSKFKIFRLWSSCISIKGISRAATWKQIFTCRRRYSNCTDKFIFYLTMH